LHITITATAQVAIETAKETAAAQQQQH